MFNNDNLNYIIEIIKISLSEFLNLDNNIEKIKNIIYNADIFTFLINNKIKIKIGDYDNSLNFMKNYLELIVRNVLENNNKTDIILDFENFMIDNLVENIYIRIIIFLLQDSKNSVLDKNIKILYDNETNNNIVNNILYKDIKNKKNIISNYSNFLNNKINSEQIDYSNNFYTKILHLFYNSESDLGAGHEDSFKEIDKLTDLNILINKNIIEKTDDLNRVIPYYNILKIINKQFSLDSVTLYPIIKKFMEIENFSVNKLYNYFFSRLQINGLYNLNPYKVKVLNDNLIANINNNKINNNVEDVKRIYEIEKATPGDFYLLDYIDDDYCKIFKYSEDLNKIFENKFFIQETIHIFIINIKDIKILDNDRNHEIIVKDYNGLILTDLKLLKDIKKDISLIKENGYVSDTNNFIKIFEKLMSFKFKSDKLNEYLSTNLEIIKIFDKSSTSNSENGKNFEVIIKILDNLINLIDNLRKENSKFSNKEYFFKINDNLCDVNHNIIMSFEEFQETDLYKFKHNLVNLNFEENKESVNLFIEETLDYPPFRDVLSQTFYYFFKTLYYDKIVEQLFNRLIEDTTKGIYINFNTLLINKLGNDKFQISNSLIDKLHLIDFCHQQLKSNTKSKFIFGNFLINFYNLENIMSFFDNIVDNPVKYLVNVYNIDASNQEHIISLNDITNIKNTFQIEFSTNMFLVGLLKFNAHCINNINLINLKENLFQYNIELLNKTIFNNICESFIDDDINISDQYLLNNINIQDIISIIINKNNKYKFYFKHLLRKENEFKTKLNDYFVIYFKKIIEIFQYFIKTNNDINKTKLDYDKLLLKIEVIYNLNEVDLVKDSEELEEYSADLNSIDIDMLLADIKKLRTIHSTFESLPEQESNNFKQKLLKNILFTNSSKMNVKKFINIQIMEDNMIFSNMLEIIENINDENYDYNYEFRTPDEYNTMIYDFHKKIKEDYIKLHDKYNNSVYNLNLPEILNLEDRDGLAEFNLKLFNIYNRLLENKMNKNIEYNTKIKDQSTDFNLNIREKINTFLNNNKNYFKFILISILDLNKFYSDNNIEDFKIYENITTNIDNINLNILNQEFTNKLINKSNIEDINKKNAHDLTIIENEKSQYELDKDVKFKKSVKFEFNDTLLFNQDSFLNNYSFYSIFLDKFNDKLLVESFKNDILKLDDLMNISFNKSIKEFLNENINKEEFQFNNLTLNSATISEDIVPIGSTDYYSCIILLDCYCDNKILEILIKSEKLKINEDYSIKINKMINNDNIFDLIKNNKFLDITLDDNEGDNKYIMKLSFYVKNNNYLKTYSFENLNENLKEITLEFNLFNSYYVNLKNNNYKYLFSTDKIMKLGYHKFNKFNLNSNLINKNNKDITINRINDKYINIKETDYDTIIGSIENYIVKNNIIIKNNINTLYENFKNIYNNFSSKLFNVIPILEYEDDATITNLIFKIDESSNKKYYYLLNDDDTENIDKDFNYYKRDIVENDSEFNNFINNDLKYKESRYELIYNYVFNYLNYFDDIIINDKSYIDLIHDLINQKNIILYYINNKFDTKFKNFNSDYKQILDELIQNKGYNTYLDLGDNKDYDDFKNNSCNDMIINHVLDSNSIHNKYNFNLIDLNKNNFTYINDICRDILLDNNFYIKIDEYTNIFQNTYNYFYEINDYINSHNEYIDNYFKGYINKFIDNYEYFKNIKSKNRNNISLVNIQNYNLCYYLQSYNYDEMNDKLKNLNSKFFRNIVLLLRRINNEVRLQIQKQKCFKFLTIFIKIILQNIESEAQLNELKIVINNEFLEGKGYDIKKINIVYKKIFFKNVVEDDLDESNFFTDTGFKKLKDEFLFNHDVQYSYLDLDTRTVSLPPLNTNANVLKKTSTY